MEYCSECGVKLVKGKNWYPRASMTYNTRCSKCRREYTMRRRALSPKQEHVKYIQKCAENILPEEEQLTDEFVECLFRDTCFSKLKEKYMPNVWEGQPIRNKRDERKLNNRLRSPRKEWGGELPALGRPRRSDMYNLCPAIFGNGMPAGLKYRKSNIKWQRRRTGLKSAWKKYNLLFGEVC